MLADVLQAGHYVVLHPDSPSFVSPAGVGSTLDIVLTKVADNCSLLRSVTDLSSDHLPVVFELDHATKQRQQSQLRNYHRLIENRVPEDPPMEKVEEIDAVLRCLTDDIAEAEQRYIPTSPMTRKFANLDVETKRIISLMTANK